MNLLHAARLLFHHGSTQQTNGQSLQKCEGDWQGSTPQPNPFKKPCVFFARLGQDVLKIALNNSNTSIY